MHSYRKILFIDVETVPQAGSFDALSEELQALWNEKFALLRKRMPEKYDADTTAPMAFMTSGGIYAEFGKIICISMGLITEQDNRTTLRITSLAGKDERQLLVDFTALIDKFFVSSEYNFCGHNIKEFDIPYICRRMLINGLSLPAPLQISNKKPWEVHLLDTMDFWKFGDYKSYTSLKLLTAVLGIPTPKDDIDGSQVAAVYYNDDDLPRIVAYCEKDVLATAQVWLKLNGLPLIEPDNVKKV